jgi:hypothetical protein
MEASSLMILSATVITGHPAIHHGWTAAWFDLAHHRRSEWDRTGRMVRCASQRLKPVLGMVLSYNPSERIIKWARYSARRQCFVRSGCLNEPRPESIA